MSVNCSADITPEMLKLCRVTKVRVFFLVLVYVFNFDLSEFSAAILEKGLLLNKRPIPNLFNIKAGQSSLFSHVINNKDIFLWFSRQYRLYVTVCDHNKS